MMRSRLLSALLAAAALIASTALPAEARTYLVAVGVADYSAFPQKIDNLRLPPADARAVADIYALNSDVDYTLLIDSKATAERIVRAIDKVIGAAGADDTAVLFFSGHGYSGGFCAADGKLSYKEIIDAMARSKCPNKIILADACHAGALRVDAADGNGGGGAEGNVMLFLSSRNTESSIEHGMMPLGFFTAYLVKALRGNADADRDRTITARELFDFVHKGVTELSKDRQHPVMWGRFADDMPVMKW